VKVGIQSNSSFTDTVGYEWGGLQKEVNKSFKEETSSTANHVHEFHRVW